ncbi:hypothetical protein NL108_018271 [Boleophthalmus pectinirostris]|nr:hypothetical protein NL108_018271 [Boleophthalmus pectinirostris]
MSGSRSTRGVKVEAQPKKARSKCKNIAKKVEEPEEVFYPRKFQHVLEKKRLPDPPLVYDVMCPFAGPIGEEQLSKYRAKIKKWLKLRETPQKSPQNLKEMRYKAELESYKKTKDFGASFENVNDSKPGHSEEQTIKNETNFAEKIDKFDASKHFPTPKSDGYKTKRTNRDAEKRSETIYENRKDVQKFLANHKNVKVLSPSDFLEKSDKFMESNLYRVLKVPPVLISSKFGVSQKKSEPQDERVPPVCEARPKRSIASQLINAERLFSPIKVTPQTPIQWNKSEND